MLFLPPLPRTFLSTLSGAEAETRAEAEAGAEAGSSGALNCVS
jgi:hypothetical protein